MNILLCTGIFPPEIGGPATYTQNLAEELIKRGHKVRVVTYSDNRKPEVGSLKSERSDFPIFRITRSRFKPWHYYKYYRAVKKYGVDADVLYAQDSVSAGYPTYLAAKIIKKPYVVKITGDYSWEQAMGRGLTDKLIDEFQTLLTYPKVIRKMREIQTLVCQKAACVITPSKYLKKIVTGWGVKEEKIQVIYNAVPEISGFNREQERQRMGLGEDDFLVVSAGRPVPWKGFEALKGAVREINNSKIKLEILTNQPHEKLMGRIKAADVFALNTGYEGFSHLILEAMSLGTPIITTNAGGNAEIFEHETNGLLVEYNNRTQLRLAIERLYEDTALRRNLARAAVQTFEKFAGNLSQNYMFNEILGALQKCVS